MHALIVDDSRAMRKILQLILETLGYQAVHAAHGQEGLEQLHAHPEVSLVLVDWNMPVMNGLEFVRAVRANAAFKSLKLVMVTTETEPAQMARALFAGVDEFVMKPFTAEILIDKLRLIGAVSSRVVTAQV